MSALTHALRVEKPSRKLCLEAAARIENLEETLIEVLNIAYGLSPKGGMATIVEQGLKQPERHKG